MVSKMAEENKYELDKEYAPLGIVDATDGSGTTWSQMIDRLNKMDEQIAALIEFVVSQKQTVDGWYSSDTNNGVVVHAYESGHEMAVILRPSGNTIEYKVDEVTKWTK